MQRGFTLSIYFSALLAIGASAQSTLPGVLVSKLHNLRISGSSAFFGQVADGSQNFVFMTTDVPDAPRILVQADLAANLTTAQSALVHSISPGHIAIVVNCPSFDLLTITNAKTGKIKKTGTGRECRIESLK